MPTKSSFMLRTTILNDEIVFMLESTQQRQRLELLSEGFQGFVIVAVDK